MGGALNNVQLNKEGAQALRDFADAMHEPLDNIMEDTEKLKKTYTSLQDSLGVHAQDFETMLERVFFAHISASGSIEALQDKLYSLAEKIDEYVDRNPDI